MKIQEEEQLELLKQSLKKFCIPLIDQQKKALIKQNLFQRLAKEGSAKVPGTFAEPAKGREQVGRILRLASEVSLSSVGKARIKESLMEAIENTIQKSFFWSKFLSFSYKAVSMVLVVAIGFGVLNFFNQKPFVRAATFSSFESVFGRVLVKRNGNFIPAYEGLNIMERDEISTSPNSFAVVKYFDDSITRLSESTKVVINKLGGSEKNTVNSYVEINLKEGILWSKVINLLEVDSSFVVKAADFSATTKKGAFNIEVLEDGVKFGVFNNVVEVNDGKKINQILHGEKLEVNDESGLAQKSKLLESEKKNQWVQENLEEDIKYLSRVEQKLIETRLMSLGVESVDEISFDNSLRESAALFLSFDAVSESKVKLGLAEKNFIAAQVKLQDMNLSEEEKAKAQAAVEDFELKVKDFYEIVDEVGVTDKNYAAELKAYVDGKILAQRKDLSLTLPGSPLYPAKELVQDLEFLMANDDTELLEIKKKQASEKVAVIEDLASKGDFEVASDVLTEYKEDIATVIDGAVGLEVKDRVASEVVTDLKLLDVSLKVAGSEVQETKQEVIEIAQDAGIVPVPVLEINVNTEVVLDPVEVVVEPTPAPTTIDGPFGIKIQGDKPLDPLLE